MRTKALTAASLLPEEKWNSRKSSLNLNRRIVIYTAVIFVLLFNLTVSAGNQGPTSLLPVYGSSFSDKSKISSKLSRIHEASSKTGKALALIGGFYHRHSDFISNTVKLTLASVYNVGMLFPEDIPHEITYGSYALAIYAENIGLPFIARLATKSVGDTRYAYKEKSKEVMLESSMRTANHVLSAALIPVNTATATMLIFDKTFDLGRLGCKYAVPLRVVAYILDSSLGVYSIILSKRANREQNKRSNRAASSLDNAKHNTDEASNRKLILYTRAMADPETWGQVVKKQEQDISSSDLVNDHENIFKEALDIIQGQQWVTLADSLIGRGSMSASKLFGPGKNQAFVDQIQVFLSEIVQGMNKIKQGKHRDRLKSSDNIDKTTQTTSSFAYDIVENIKNPIALRLAAVRGCSSYDSCSIASDPNYDIRLRMSATLNCSAAHIEVLLEDQAFKNEFQKLITDVAVAEGNPQATVCGELSYEPYQASPSPPIDDIDIENIAMLSQQELFNVASDPDEDLSTRCGAASFLVDCKENKGLFI